MALFLGTLEFVVEEGPRNDWFEDRRDRHRRRRLRGQRRAVLLARPDLPQPDRRLRAFKDRNFAIGCLFSFVIGIGLYGSVYIMPLFLGQVRG